MESITAGVDIYELVDINKSFESFKKLIRYDFVYMRAAFTRERPLLIIYSL